MTRISNVNHILTATTDPVAPNVGDMYFNTQKNTLLRWSGSNWLGYLMSTTSTSTTTTTSTSTSTTTTTTSTSSSTTTTTSTSTTTTG